MKFVITTRTVDECSMNEIIEAPTMKRAIEIAINRTFFMIEEFNVRYATQYESTYGV